MKAKPSTNLQTNDEINLSVESALPYPAEKFAEGIWQFDMAATICPNCGARLEGRKCKLHCPRAGCGYVVTCAEW